MSQEWSELLFGTTPQDVMMGFLREAIDKGGEPLHFHECYLQCQGIARFVNTVTNCARFSIASSRFLYEIEQLKESKDARALLKQIAKESRDGMS